MVESKRHWHVSASSNFLALEKPFIKVSLVLAQGAVKDLSLMGGDKQAMIGPALILWPFALVGAHQLSALVYNRFLAVQCQFQELGIGQACQVNCVVLADLGWYHVMPNGLPRLAVL
jgi:hypothetical protein